MQLDFFNFGISCEDDVIKIVYVAVIAFDSCAVKNKRPISEIERFFGGELI